MVSLKDSVDFKGLRKVHLLLGPECNMRCRHCHQSPEKEVVYPCGDSLSDDVLSFLDRYIAYSQDRDVLEGIPEHDRYFTVEFYGGEPLLHWGLIRDTVVRYTEKFGLLGSRSFRFSLVTNGLGLTEEIVDFVNRYGIDFSLSYDAPYPFAVRGYVSDRICSLANRVENLTIICSGCAYNCDPVLAYRCLMVKFPEARYVIRTEVLRTFAEMDDDIDRYDAEKLRRSVRRLFIAAKLKDEFAFDYVSRIFHFLVHPEDNYFHANGGVGACVSGHRELSVRTDGTVAFCYNSGDVLGHVATDSLETIHGKAVRIWKDAYDPACATCEARPFCNWGCMLALRDGNRHMSACERYRKPFFRIVKEEMGILLEPLSKKDYDWFREEEYVMDRQVRAFLAEGRRYGKEHTGLPKELFA